MCLRQSTNIQKPLLFIYLSTAVSSLKAESQPMGGDIIGKFPQEEKKLQN
jgi:hypothetical protein